MGHEPSIISIRGIRITLTSTLLTTRPLGQPEKFGCQFHQSKALAARMKNVIHSFIFYVQTALYVKGRYVCESVCLIDDLFEYAEDENIDRILFAADIEKAFHSVYHNFMFTALTRFGFGNNFVQCNNRLFKKIETMKMCVWGSFNLC